MTAPEGYIVLDTETTGLRACDRVIELAAVKVRSGVIVDQRSQLIDPGMPLPPFITRLTGITPEMLAGRSRMEMVLPRFLAWTEGLPVVGHNVAFDMGMLRREGERAHMPVNLAVAADTLYLARKRLPEMRSHRLGALVEQLHIECKPAHRALADVYATQALYELLLQMPESSGHTRGRQSSAPHCSI